MSYNKLCDTCTQDPRTQNLYSDDLTFSLKDCTRYNRIPVTSTLITRVSPPSILQQPDITLTLTHIETKKTSDSDKETCVQCIRCGQNGTQNKNNCPYRIDWDLDDKSDDDNAYYVNNNSHIKLIFTTADTTAKRTKISYSRDIV